MLEIQQSLFEYEVMAPQQIATLLGYKRKSIWAFLQKMSANKEIKKKDIPVMGRGSKVYSLTAAAAREVAEARNEIHYFKEKEWETWPGNLLQQLIANQFFCELIRSTREVEHSGLTEWSGRRNVMQLYAHQMDVPDMNGYGIFIANGTKRHIHLNVLTGYESMKVLEEMVIAHYQLLQDHWQGNTLPKVIMLFLCLHPITVTRVNKLLEKMSRNRVNRPYVAVTLYSSLTSQGIFSNNWSSIGIERDSILQMPGIESKYDGPFLGKQLAINLQRKSTLNFLEIEDLALKNVAPLSGNESIDHGNSETTSNEAETTHTDNKTNVQQTSFWRK